MRHKGWFSKHELQRIALGTLAVYADSDASGISFYSAFSQTAAPMASGAASSERTSIVNQLNPLDVAQQSLGSRKRTDACGTVTAECEAGSFSSMRQWLLWLKATMKWSVIVLFVRRREAQTPVCGEKGSRSGLLGSSVDW
ncbi:hypothetical protein LPMP_283090 [Leishmania panamensis]|uniref:Uncharacterized protein n=2 Tax=Leishmania guyanensis species complex TaxID=38579 RepID=A0A088SDV8_LEIPA|nr:hypothetical protein LPMP_283090 [Leishmania panamensis]AIN99941.1 hypothetical protein LPMP_283090 [Leishmania panamensis]